MKIVPNYINKLKFLAYRIVLPFLIKYFYFLFPRNKKTLLLIKIDGIGDYILFRNFLRFIRESEKYKDYKIYLLANESQKDLAMYLDNQFIDNFYWYSDNYFLKFKLITLLLSLQQLRLQTLVYFNYSRKFTADLLVNNIHADLKIGVDGDLANTTYKHKSKSDHFYNNLIKFNKLNQHEFEYNKLIAEYLVDNKCNYLKPTIDKSKLKFNQHNHFIVFPGGSIEAKKWSTLHYIEVCKLLLSNSNRNIALAGSEAEFAENNKIKNSLANERILDFTSKLNLIQLCELIAGCKFLISNDTVAIHIAVSLDIPCLCIAKGDYFGRFIPYPDYIFKKMICAIPKEANNKYELSSVNINNILPINVWNKIVEFDKTHSIL